MKKPNILFVFADQLRYTALGSSGNRVVQTPNIDQLGREGLIMDRAFSACPICSPYRGQLLTGNYSHVNGVVCNEYRLFDDQNTIAHYLKPHGYQTAYVGKWHLGHGPYYEHMRYGFDDLIAFNNMAGYFDISYFRNEEGPFPMGGYEVTIETDLVIEYMRRPTDPDQPWCVFMSCQAPHSTGLHYGSRYRDFPQKFAIYDEEGEIQLSDNVPLPYRDFTRKELTGYYGMVTSIDWNIGRIMDELEHLGIADETIICFSSDHGDHVHAHGMGHPSDNWAHHSMRGAKATPYDESIHIPFIIRYPDKEPLA